MTETDRSAARRRLLLRAAAAVSAEGLHRRLWAHTAGGLVTPALVPPNIRLRLHDGRPAGLASVLQGRVTAVQLMFTGCSAICPIQGALFAELQHALAALPTLAPRVQMLSVSIDPLGDDPAALRTWLARFGAGPHWKAASPLQADLDTWLDFLQGRRAGADRHTAQVYLFDTGGRLVLRTVDFPTVPEMTRLLGELAGRSNRGVSGT